jgi:hypothetical protein
MRAKLVNGVIEYFKQPDWILGDATKYAIENGYKELITIKGTGGIYETEENIVQEIAPTIKKFNVLTPKEFLSRFTLAEWEAIENACTVSSAMRFWMKKYDKSQDIDLEDPETIDGMNSMVQFGLITPERLPVIMEIKTVELIS